MAVTLDEIRKQIADCKKCPLWETRTNIVFGGPNPTARVMIVGEAPGKNEDLSGQPFVGVSGKKLDALLEEVGLSRQDVFISNVVKCRPPSNRNPKVAEVEEWLKAQPGVLGAQVSGSGSSSFALCESRDAADAIAAAAQVKGWRGFSTTCKL